MKRDLRKLVLARLPNAAFEEAIRPGGDETWRAPAYGERGGTTITITVPTPADMGGIHLGALRRAGQHPTFIESTSVSILIPNDASRVQGLRDGGRFFAFSRGQWADVDEEKLEDIVDELASRVEMAQARNQFVADQMRAHPANQSADAQIRREREITADLPTHEVDAWIIAHMDYTADELASLASSTRRDRRREARQKMKDLR